MSNPAEKQQEAPTWHDYHTTWEFNETDASLTISFHKSVIRLQLIAENQEKTKSKSQKNRNTNTVMLIPLANAIALRNAIDAEMNRVFLSNYLVIDLVKTYEEWNDDNQNTTETSEVDE